MPADTLATFRRHVRAAAGVYARQDSGQLTGRNGNLTADSLDYHVRKATELLTADAHTDDAPLCAYLDTPRGAKLAAAWSRVERRHVGLYA